MSQVLATQVVLFARDGSLWFTVWGAGVWRLPSPASIPTGRGLLPSDPLEKFERPDGLASPVVVPVLEDTEGTVWVGTNAGLASFVVTPEGRPRRVAHDRPGGGGQRGTPREGPVHRRVPDL